MNTDIVIVGAGPAGIFTALEMIRRGSKQKIVMLDKGAAIENRKCPKSKTKQCVNCKPTAILLPDFQAQALSPTESCRSAERLGAIFRSLSEKTWYRIQSVMPTKFTLNSAPTNILRDWTTPKKSKTYERERFRQGFASLTVPFAIWALKKLMGYIFQ